ncbi:MAG: sigma-70 family RNA polymerase sigma factor [Gemmatimonadaceae bacterium]|nr:sigma-70 family RNA polymerase sigma factor [Gemmatimonadaceae bacterium]
MARMAAGDEQALGALYDRFATTVHTLAYYLLGQADEAEDAVEETFWQAWREAARYDPSRGAVSTWLSTIGRSRALDRQRALRRRAEEPLESVAPISPDAGDRADAIAPAADPQRDAEASERARDIAVALRSLPAEQRQVIELAYFAGLSQSEIAARSVSSSTTRSTSSRLRRETGAEACSSPRATARRSRSDHVARKTTASASIGSPVCTASPGVAPGMR